MYDRKRAKRDRNMSEQYYQGLDQGNCANVGLPCIIRAKVYRGNVGSPLTVLYSYEYRKSAQEQKIPPPNYVAKPQKFHGNRANMGYTIYSVIKRTGQILVYRVLVNFEMGCTEETLDSYR